jgi:rubrerythrin
MDARLQQLIYGVMQEYAAKIAYSSVADVAGDPNVESLLRRVAKDEMRHCRFFQLCLEAMAENVGEEIRSEIFPQFTALFKDHRMPQEHIAIFSELDMGTDLYIKFWTPEYRSNLLLYLTNYFRAFKTAKSERAAAPIEA